MSSSLQLASPLVKIKVAEHPNTHVNEIYGYIVQVAIALAQRDLDLTAAWLDPSDPRDATIGYQVDGQKRALVWDEVTGWRDGEFISGHQGVRTTLYDVQYFGNGVLPTPTELADLVSDGIGSTDRIEYRSFTDQDDLAERLQAYRSA